MNEVDRLRKLLAEANAGEQGWRKVLTTAEGSFSRALAEKNLHRLAALREKLLHELDEANSYSATGDESARTL